MGKDRRGGGEGCRRGRRGRKGRGGGGERGEEEEGEKEVDKKGKEERGRTRGGERSKRRARGPARLSCGRAGGEGPRDRRLGRSSSVSQGASLIISAVYSPPPPSFTSPPSLSSSSFPSSWLPDLLILLILFPLLYPPPPPPYPSSPFAPSPFPLRHGSVPKGTRTLLRHPRPQPWLLSALLQSARSVWSLSCVCPSECAQPSSSLLFRDMPQLLHTRSAVALCNGALLSHLRTR